MLSSKSTAQLLTNEEWCQLFSKRKSNSPIRHPNGEVTCKVGKDMLVARWSRDGKREYCRISDYFVSEAK